MRFIIANEFYQQMLQTPDHTPDCYVRPGEYLHHLYLDGVKYVIAPAVIDCLADAEAKGDAEAVSHLMLHKVHFESLMADAERFQRIVRHQHGGAVAEQARCKIL